MQLVDRQRAAGIMAGGGKKPGGQSAIKIPAAAARGRFPDTLASAFTIFVYPTASATVSHAPSTLRISDAECRILKFAGNQGMQRVLLYVQIGSDRPH